MLLGTRCKYRTQKSRQKSPSGHHRTTSSGYIFATKAHIDNRKKLVKQQYLLYMSPQYSERPTSAARWKCGTQKSPKIRHLRTIAQLCRAITSQLRHMLTIGKKELNSNISPTCPYNMVNFGPLAAEIGPVVWGTPS